MDTHAQTDQIRTIIAEVMEVSQEQLGGDVNFVTDLGADSLRSIEILARLETCLGLHIPQTYLAQMVTLNEVCKVVAEAEQLALGDAQADVG
jgi:acyl carrier protein